MYPDTMVSFIAWKMKVRISRYTWGTDVSTRISVECNTLSKDYLISACNIRSYPIQISINCRFSNLVTKPYLICLELDTSSKEQVVVLKSLIGEILYFSFNYLWISEKIVIILRDCSFKLSTIWKFSEFCVRSSGDIFLCVFVFEFNILSSFCQTT